MSKLFITLLFSAFAMTTYAADTDKQTDGAELGTNETPQARDQAKNKPKTSQKQAKNKPKTSIQHLQTGRLKNIIPKKELVPTLRAAVIRTAALLRTIPCNLQKLNQHQGLLISNVKRDCCQQSLFLQPSHFHLSALDSLTPHQPLSLNNAIQSLA